MNCQRFRFHRSLEAGIVFFLLVIAPSACDLGPVPTPTPTPTTVPPAATATPRPAASPTTAPTALQPTNTAKPAPTPTPTVEPTKPAPTAPATEVSYKYPAPELVTPPDGQGFAGEFRWKPMDLAPDEYFNVAISYHHNNELRFWGGNAKEPILIPKDPKAQWEKSDDDFYTWWVQVLRDTGRTDEEGDPVGIPVSPKSEVWRFYYEP